jgi:hypothetical protein
MKYDIDQYYEAVLGLIRKAGQVSNFTDVHIVCATILVSRVKFTTTHCPVHVRSEVLTAMTMKNAVFWDIKAQFVPHRRHITSPLHSPAI